MQLFLDSYGAFLGVQNGMFWVKPKRSEGRAFAIREVNAIFLTKGVSMSSDAMALAVENSIPVLLLNGIGHPVAQIWSGQYGSISTIRKKQALFATDLQGVRWIREVLMQKMQQQTTQLAYWRESWGADTATTNLLRKCVAGIDGIIFTMQNWQYESQSFNEIAGAFRGWEGTATRYYFKGMAALLPPLYRFEGRSKRPAYDPFNALLNYLYGMLYAYVELAQMKAGLDPYTGVLHADEYNRPTLVYDMIEIYRQWAERIAMELCINNRLPADSFTETEREGVRLVSPGKGVVTDTFLAFLNDKTEYKSQVRKRLTHIDLDAIRLATSIKNFEPSIRII
ncbi:MAG: CRISPR-associated endonuclease Cas1 [Saprospiraceae bacterium]|nr:CRISPR-associated endonuclease Cas1 [Saprospiraceae bacterium]